MRYNDIMLVQRNTISKTAQAVMLGVNYIMIKEDLSSVGLRVLKDTGRGGRVRPWTAHKLANGYMAIAYDEVDNRKAERLRGCASWLEYVHDGEVMRLHSANFCRVRLCPICQWRRSLKTYSQMMDIMRVASDTGYRYIFLTLTMRNCYPDELSSALDKLMLSFNRLIKYKAVKSIIKGYYRGTEVTHNIGNDTYHPHLHCVLAVNKSYFDDTRRYLSQARWTELWQRALQVEYTPIVDVRAVKGNIERAVAECSKYAVKVGDVLHWDDWDLTVDTVRTLDKAFDNRRFIGLGGVFRAIHKELSMDDMDKGDFVHTGDDSDVNDDTLPRVVYWWHTGYNQYVAGD